MKKTTWSLLLIGLGLVLLLNNFGLLAWSVGEIVWRFWPIFLILFGLELILGDSSWGKVALIVVGLIILGLVFSLSISPAKPKSISSWPIWNRALSWSKKTFPKNKEQEFTITNEAYPNIKKRSLKIDLGFGQLTISGQERISNLFYLKAQYQDPFGVPQITTDLDDEENIIINFNNRHDGFIIPGRLLDQINYQIVLGQTGLPTQLFLKMGAGQAEVDLSQITTEAISLEVGAGRVFLDLSRASLPEKGLTINLGAGQTEISLPQENPINLSYHLGAGKILIGQREIGGPGRAGQVLIGQKDGQPLNLEANVGAGKLIINYQ